MNIENHQQLISELIQGEDDIHAIIVELGDIIKSGFNWVNFTNEPELKTTKVSEDDLYLPDFLELVKTYVSMIEPEGVN